MTIAHNDNVADDKTIVNVLGIQWNTSQDTLAISILSQTVFISEQYLGN